MSKPTTVWKFVIEIPDAPIPMPAGAKVLHVAAQDNQICLWAAVDKSAPLRPRRFLVRGTGHDLDGANPNRHVGSVLLDGGRLVFHIFEAEG